MVFRPARATDIPHLHSIRLAVRENKLSSPSLITEADYEDYLTVRGKGWVCEAEGNIVGFAIADLVANNVWALFVHPHWEGRGIGTALHDQLLDWYFAQTAATLWLSTASGTRAEGFYRKLGWKEAGIYGIGELRFEMHHSEL